MKDKQKDIICSYDGERGENCDCGCVDTEAVKKPLYHIDNKRKFNPAFDEYMHPEEAYKPDF